MASWEPPSRRGPPAAGAGTGVGGADLAAVADLLLSSSPARPASVVAGPGAPAARPAASSPSVACEEAAAPSAAPSAGARADGLARAQAPFYLVVPAGVDPGRRWAAALQAVRCLAPAGRASAVVLVGGGRAEGLVVGETARTRLGPPVVTEPADLDGLLQRVVPLAGPLAMVLLDAPEAVPVGAMWPGRREAVDRPLFVTFADAEGLIETYRTLKGWRRGAAAGRAAVFYLVDGEAVEGSGVAGLHARLARAAARCLGARLRMEGAAAVGGDGLPLVRLFAGLPAGAVWAALRRLVPRRAEEGPAFSGAVGGAGEVGAGAGPAAGPAPVDEAPSRAGRAPRPLARAPGEHGSGGAAAVRTDAPAEAAAPPRGGAVVPAFRLWEPKDRQALFAALADQLPGLLGEGLRTLFPVGVAEPGAPALVGLRPDGAMVAVVVAEADEPVDTAATEAWVRAHRGLLVRAFGLGAAPPGSGGRMDGAVPAARDEAASAARDGAAEGEASVATVVLSPVRPGAGDGRLRFVPVRLGGRRGVVIVG